ncbi:potassium channel family protein [Deinococcus hohokamensis]|uniref:Potassium channel family protein n=1 Tax=Deinococcus hohokamensis TaxID=309883 RepID=A0ABV9I9D0_9DEIO
MPLTILMWAAILWLAFSLLLLPYAASFQSTRSDPLPDWFKAFYISGYSMTTLGIGDLVPSGKAPRLVIVLASAMGFILITVAVTYLLSVYAALERMSALAFEIHHFIGRSEGMGPVEVLKRAAQTRTPDELSNWLASTASGLAQVVQSEDEFPLLHYFHMPDERAMPLALMDLLELTSLCQSVLDPEAYPVVAGGLVSAGTQRIVLRYFGTLTPRYAHVEVSEARLAHDRQWRFDAAWNALDLAGIKLRPRPDALERYVRLRQQWDAHSVSLCLQFGYPAFEAWPVGVVVHSEA